ncbi:MAG: 50S ribosomal protein L13 [Candidatus Heimdallarchaeota archaeon]|nr:50S ribosomal protein L13 [Candidatus Heimdallarchaeota archaeon]
MSKQNVTYIDGTGLVLGRLSSWLAKKLLAGEKVVVVNAQDVIITGTRRSLIKDYQQRRARAVHTNPKRGPFFPRFPDRILRRTVRGMLPWKTTSGRLAYRRLAAYINIPDEMADKSFETLPDAHPKSMKKYITVGELAKEIGWKHEERV